MTDMQFQDFEKFGESIELDLWDKEHPLSVDVDGFLTLEDAEQLHTELGQAIARARQKWPKEAPTQS
jgi:hypothetical protein